MNQHAPRFDRVVALFVPAPALEPLAYVPAPDGIAVVRLHNLAPANTCRPWLSLPRVALLGWAAGLLLAFVALPQPKARQSSQASTIVFAAPPAPAKTLARLR